VYSRFALGLLCAVGNFFSSFSAEIPPLQSHHWTIRLKTNLATLAKVRILPAVIKPTIVIAPFQMRSVTTLTLRYFAAHITSKEIDNGAQRLRNV
jgi:hypothetical protein